MPDLPNLDDGAERLDDDDRASLIQLVDNVISTTDNTAALLIEHLDECPGCDVDHGHLRAALEHCRAIQHDTAAFLLDLTADDDPDDDHGDGGGGLPGDPPHERDGVRHDP